MSVQSLSHAWLFVTPWTAAYQASLSITNSCSLLKLMLIELVMPSNHLILCHPLLLLSSIFPNITFVGKVMSLLLNTLSRFVILFLPRSKCLNFMVAVTIHSDFVESNKRKSVTASTVSPDAMILIFWMLSSFYSSLSPLSGGSLVPFQFLLLKWCHVCIWGYGYVSWQSWFQLVLHPAWHFTWCTLHRG